MRFLFLPLLFLGLSGCDSSQSDTPGSTAPIEFQSVPLKDDSAWHILKLPDGGRLLIKSQTIDEKNTITSISIQIDGGIPYAVDYVENESLFSAPPFDSFSIWQRQDGAFVRASKAVHQRHMKASEMLSDFFGKHVGRKGDVDEAVKDLKQLKTEIKNLYEEK